MIRVRYRVRRDTALVEFRPVIAGCLCLSLLVVLSFAQQQTDERRPRVALTFDDLPDHGPPPPGLTRVDVATSIIGALTSHHAPPVYGFINAKQLEAHPADVEVLRLWRKAGFPLQWSMLNAQC
jgi:peptidoglycan/xylan/chitin deacetylase (PgdA/CDA1 family)